MACEELKQDLPRLALPRGLWALEGPMRKAVDGCCSDQAGVQPDEVTYYAVISALTSDRGPVCVCSCVQLRSKISEG